MSGSVTPSDQQIPVTFGDELPDAEKSLAPRWESDVVPFKPMTDVILVGKAHAPSGLPAPWVDATLRVGPVVKSLRVFGERKWVCNGKQAYRDDDAPAAVRVDGYRPGKGVRRDRADRRDVRGEPRGARILRPGKRRRARKDVPPERGGPEGPTATGKTTRLQRVSESSRRGRAGRTRHLGTFDERWEKERPPAPPADARPDFHNAAQPDLQVPGFLQGDEEVELVNLTPEGRLRFRLPGVRPTVAVTRADIEFLGWDAPPSTETVDMRLDTLCLLPGEKRFFLLWRGSCPVKDLGALEIREVAVKT